MSIKATDLNSFAISPANGIRNGNQGYQMVEFLWIVCALTVNKLQVLRLASGHIILSCRLVIFRQGCNDAVLHAMK